MAFFWVMGAFEPPRDPTRNVATGSALFFATVLAYIVPVFHYITIHTDEALRALAPAVDGLRHLIEESRRRLTRKPPAWFALSLTFGCVGGVAHMLILFPEVTPREPRVATAMAIGTMAAWIVIFYIYGAVLDNARMFRDVAKHTHVDLLNVHLLRPFAIVAVSSTIGIVGVGAAMPLMLVLSEPDVRMFIPGLAILTTPVLAAFTVWPIHRRIAAAKADEVARANTAIAELGKRTRPSEELSSWLTYRREILQAPEWPFDSRGAARLALYIIIPPISWLGAALIEIWVEANL